MQWLEEMSSPNKNSPTISVNMAKLYLKTFSDFAISTSLVKLFYSLIDLTVKKVFKISKINITFFNFSLLWLVLTVASVVNISS